MPDITFGQKEQKFSILLLADNKRGHANTVLDHIAMFTDLSSHEIRIFNPKYLKKSKSLDLDEFDVVVIHYSLTIISDYYLSPEFRETFKNYQGLKVHSR